MTSLLLTVWGVSARAVTSSQGLRHDERLARGPAEGKHFILYNIKGKGSYIVYYAERLVKISRDNLPAGSRSPGRPKRRWSDLIID